MKYKQYNSLARVRTSRAHSVAFQVGIHLESCSVTGAGLWQAGIASKSAHPFCLCSSSCTALRAGQVQLARTV